MIGIYHSRDLDGWASGAIIKKRYPEAKMIGYDYGKSIDLPEWHPEPIIMADVSMPMPDMLNIAKICNWQFTWIDHHISAINDFKKFTENSESFCTPVLDTSISACEGTWRYLFPEEEMPLSIKLLGEYDTWRNQDVKRWENEILPFQYGMRLTCNSLETFPEWILTATNDDIEEIIAAGLVVLKYQRQQNEYACRGAFEFEFEGYKAICLNGGGFNSESFKSIYDETKHDIMMPFAFNGKFWTISMYTTKDIDLSLIAKSKGGGGHKRAAGFQVNDIKTLFPMI